MAGVLRNFFEDFQHPTVLFKKGLIFGGLATAFWGASIVVPPFGFLAVSAGALATVGGLYVASSVGSAIGEGIGFVLGKIFKPKKKKTPVSVQPAPVMTPVKENANVPQRQSAPSIALDPSQRLAALLEEISSLKREMAALRNEIQTLSEENARLKRQIAMLQQTQPRGPAHTLKRISVPSRRRPVVERKTGSQVLR